MPEATAAPEATASGQVTAPVTRPSHVRASVSTTLGGVPRVCRGPATHWVTPKGGTRTPRRTVATAVRYTLEELAERVPGNSVEVPSGSARQALRARVPSAGSTRRRATA